jgi:hypothetical protein
LRSTVFHTPKSKKEVGVRFNKKFQRLSKSDRVSDRDLVFYANDC